MEDYKRVRAAKLGDIYELRAALREFLHHRQAKQSDNPITKAEDALRGQKLPGFFPTPAPVIEQMLECAQVAPGHRVLEPSLKITKYADGKPVYNESTTRFRQCVFDRKGRIYPGGGDDELPEYNTDRMLSGFADPGDCPLKKGMARFCGGY